MALRIEFDPVNKILLIRFEGQLTDELVAEYSEAIRKYWTAADASAGVVDFSSVSELSLSAECIRQLAKREPCIPDAPTPATHPRMPKQAQHSPQIQADSMHLQLP